MCVGLAMCRTRFSIQYISLSSTFLPASVEDGHVFQVDTQAAPHGHCVRGVVFEASPDGPVGVGSEGHQTEGI